MNLEWMEGFDELDRRTLVLARAYEKARQEVQFGYQVFKTYDETIVDSPIFKQLRTVVRWVRSSGWEVSLREFHWQGYVEFVFRWMHPIVPMPGQLRNNRLLGDYVKSQPAGENTTPPRYSWKELEELYERKLRPELRDRAQIIAGLRIRQLQSKPK